MSEETHVVSLVPRRQALCGLIALGVLGPTALAACSAGEQPPAGAAATGSTPADPPPVDPPLPADPQAQPPPAGGADTGGTKAGGTDAGSAGTAAQTGGAVLARTSRVPVGGGVVVTAPDGRHIVIAQPSGGTFKAYNASCTHQGTTIGAPVRGTMTCPNHGSQFSAASGSVVRGPAAVPLRPVAVRVEGGNIVLGTAPAPPRRPPKPQPPAQAQPPADRPTPQPPAEDRGGHDDGGRRGHGGHPGGGHGEHDD